MNLETIVWFWLILAIVLILAETVIPGGIVICLGISSLITALLLHYNLMGGWINSVSFCLVSSVPLILISRKIVEKSIGGDCEVEDADEDADARGKIVEVLSHVGPNNELGSIYMNDTSWGAKSRDGSLISKGEKAKIVQRDGINWIIVKA